MPDAFYQRVTSNIGIVRMAALQRWADSAAAALGCTVRLYGSALTSKKWRDLDVAMQWDAWNAPRPAGGDAWLWLCHAFSVAATQEVGAPVEVHLEAEAPRDHLVLAGPASVARKQQSGSLTERADTEPTPCPTCKLPTWDGLHQTGHRLCYIDEAS